MAFIPSKEAVSEEVQDDAFAPIPAGKYNVYIFEVTQREFSETSNNAGSSYYNIQLKVADGQPHANRRIFQMVGLVPKWAPTAKNPNGSNNWLYFQLYAAAKGISEVEARKLNNEQGGLDYPDPEDLEGLLIEATIGIENNTYKGETTKRNNVRRFGIAGGGAKATNNVTPTINKANVVEIDL